MLGFSENIAEMDWEIVLGRLQWWVCQCRDLCVAAVWNGRIRWVRCLEFLQKPEIGADQISQIPFRNPYLDDNFCTGILGYHIYLHTGIIWNSVSSRTIGHVRRIVLLCATRIVWGTVERDWRWKSWWIFKLAWWSISTETNMVHWIELECVWEETVAGDRQGPFFYYLSQWPEMEPWYLLLVPRSEDIGNGL